MDLKTAIVRAEKFCAKPVKDEPYTIHNCIRFMPKVGAHPSRLMATDMRVGILIDLDDDVEIPNAAIPAKPLLQAARDCESMGDIEPKGNALFVFNTSGKKAGPEAEYAIQGLPPSEYPGFPPLPQNMTPIPDWWLVQKVFHAASPDHNDEYLDFVKFTPEWVGATDKNRVARADVAAPWDGLVQANLFKFWPKSGDVEAAFMEGHAYFRIGGDELRIAPLATSEHYPDTSTVIPEKHEGLCATVRTDKLLDVIKRAEKVSPTKSVTMEFQKTMLTIRAWSDKESDPFKSEVYVNGTGEGALIVNGKYFLETLKSLDTPRVRLGWQREALSPLRIESGGFVECIWPMLPDQA